MTFGAVKRHIDAYWKRRKNEWERTEYQAWLIGAYTMNAIAAAFSKKAKYPKNPLEQNKPVDVSNLKKDFTEVCDEMDTLGKEIGVSIRCQREEIFEKMHRL